MYDYLYARSLIGRNTTSAIRQINEILAEHPDFASGHRSLAEIILPLLSATTERERAERERFLQLCPGSALQQLPEPTARPEPPGRPGGAPAGRQRRSRTCRNMAHREFVTTSGGCNASGRSTGTASNTNAKASVNFRPNTGKCGASRFVD